MLSLWGKPKASLATNKIFFDVWLTIEFKRLSSFWS